MNTSDYVCVVDVMPFVLCGVGWWSCAEIPVVVTVTMSMCIDVSTYALGRSYTRVFYDSRFWQPFRL